MCVAWYFFAMIFETPTITKVFFASIYTDPRTALFLELLLHFLSTHLSFLLSLSLSNRRVSPVKFPIWFNSSMTLSISSLSSSVRSNYSPWILRDLNLMCKYRSYRSGVGQRKTASSFRGKGKPLTMCADIFAERRWICVSFGIKSIGFGIFVATRYTFPYFFRSAVLIPSDFARRDNGNNRAVRLRAMKLSRWHRITSIMTIAVPRRLIYSI